jgi:hypothetical protein
VNGSWDVEMGILSKLRSLVHLINGLTEEGVGVPLFKHEDSSNLHFPAAENTSRYEDAHRELYGYLVDGLNKECITKLGTHVGSPINSANLKTLDALKKVLPVLKSSTLFTSVFDKLSAKRGSASHGVRGPATRYSAFDEFANDLTGYVSALEELREELEKTLGMAAEKATRRHERKGYLPKLDQSRPIHSNYAIAQAPLMQGKTVDHVEFGFRRSIEGVHESEALIIYFTDGSILGMDTGSNVANVIADHKGTSLKEEDFHVDLNLWWVPSAR